MFAASVHDEMIGLAVSNTPKSLLDHQVREVGTQTRRSTTRMREVRLEIYVRANASTTAVGGDFDGALVVCVVEPAESGRATEASLRAVAAAIDVPRRSVTLLRGPKSRRKLVEIRVPPARARRVQTALQSLQAGRAD